MNESERRQNRSELVSVLKSQQWEKCKGELHALSSLEGSNFPVWNDNNKRAERSKWQELADKINEFIDAIEGNGLQE